MAENSVFIKPGWRNWQTHRTQKTPASFSRSREIPNDPRILRHAAITVATDESQALGLSLDKVCAFSRHRGINTLLTYVDDRDHDFNQRALAERVASTVAV